MSMLKHKRSRESTTYQNKKVSKSEEARGQPQLSHSSLMAGDDLDAALLGGEGADVPDSQRVVHGVGEDVGAVRGEGDAGDGVGVAGQAVERLGGVAQVPYLHLVVDAPADDL